MFRTFLFGAVTAVIILVAGVSFYFLAGIAPVATAAAPMPFEEFFAKAAMRARINRERPKSVPFTADEANYLEGATVYRENCAVCHGLPGAPQSSIAKGMFPEAPQLFRGKGVTDDEPGETYWKVVNGIRMTGMPAFRQSLSEHQAWEVTLMLARADALSNPVRAALAAPTGQPAAK